jgi:hypothetical protein
VLPVSKMVGFSKASQAAAVPAGASLARMGWSSAAMAKRHQHLIDTIRPDVPGKLAVRSGDADDASAEDVASANETKQDAEPGR